MRRLFLAMLIPASLALSGCVSVTSPVPIGQDAWMIGLGARGGFQSDAELLSQSVSAAGQFCAKQGRRVEVMTTSASGTQMWTPQSNTVTFKCLAA